jgi:hypothetical protein
MLAVIGTCPLAAISNCPAMVGPSLSAIVAAAPAAPDPPFCTLVMIDGLAGEDVPKDRSVRRLGAHLSGCGTQRRGRLKR